MIIYCDRLTPISCAKIIRVSWRSMTFRNRQREVQVLDSLPRNGRTIFLRFMLHGLGYSVCEADFHTGHLPGPNGQSIASAAAYASNEIAFQATVSMLEHSNSISQLNNDWGRNTIFMWIAQSLQRQSKRVTLHFMVAEALRWKISDESHLIIHHPFPLDPNSLCKISPNLTVHFYHSILPHSGGDSLLSPRPLDNIKRMRGSVLLLFALYVLRDAKWWLKLLLRRDRYAPNFTSNSATSSPSLMLLEEDGLSLDRSYRTQPHWLFIEERRPNFPIFVYHSSGKSQPTKARLLKQYGIIAISGNTPNRLSRLIFSSDPMQKRLRQSFKTCLYLSLFGSRIDTKVALAVADLIYTASEFASLCNRKYIKAFMTRENYLISANAMFLISPYMDITTISYQTSNNGKSAPQIMTTADKMLTFAPHWHHLWTHYGVAPGEFIDIGYAYDSSFEKLRARSNSLRDKLAKAGAQFVICFYDENAVNDKYSYISPEDHDAEVLSLLELVVNDPSIGLVVKTKLQRNSPQNLDRIADTRAAAMATGRYAELVHGNTHRNITFPAEAAILADIAISHAVGATAALEAALNGTRSILLNPYGIKGNNDELFAKADIMYPSMHAALKAIRDFRTGVPEKSNLGDWSPIINQFDPFRDGNAGHRMRQILEEVVLRQPPHKQK